MGGSPMRIDSPSTVSSPLHHTTSHIGGLLTPPGIIATESRNSVDAKELSNHRKTMSDDCSVNSACLHHEDGTTQSKHVAFGEICTRSFQVILGDHPACSHGTPITLSWLSEDLPSIRIDEYEASRPPRRKREDLRTTWDQRRDMLSESDEEVRMTNRKLQRERARCRKVNQRACAAFFNRDNLPEESTLPAVPETSECT